MASTPRFCFRWNDELQLLDTVPPVTCESDSRASCVLRALRVRSKVLVKRVPAEAIDGAAVDFNILLTGSIENQQTLESGMIHLLRTLTCHFARPGDDSAFYYVALEHCDFNLRDAVEATSTFVSELPAAPPMVSLEGSAPLLMWQTRRSAVRQLLSGVTFLHRTGDTAHVVT
jgi:hypothetical protein